MNQSFLDRLQTELNLIETNGLFKGERIITSPQSSKVTIEDGSEVLNMCANNYILIGLGLLLLFLFLNQNKVKDEKQCNCSA